MQNMDLNLFRQILEIDSTSGRERELSEFLSTALVDASPEGCKPSLQRFEVGDGTENLLFLWGKPEEFSEESGVIFCTHMDTVPPYIAPTFSPTDVKGRGSCDANGQIISLFSACLTLAREGRSGFGLLLLSGEETGSFGARAFAGTPFRAKHLVIGEPTENRMVTACKGTKSFDVEITGKACHSGYPGLGASAVDAFVSFVNRLKVADFPKDDILGETTWNIGRLCSDNPQNILSPVVTFKIYFRTTFATDAMVSEWMMKQRGTEGYGCQIRIKANGGDVPASYCAPEGFAAAPAAFGTDAPHLSNFRFRSIVGAGSVSVAHQPTEFVSLVELENAGKIYVKLFRTFTGL